MDNPITQENSTPNYYQYMQYLSVILPLIGEMVRNVDLSAVLMETEVNFHAMPDEETDFAKAVTQSFVDFHKLMADYADSKTG